MSNKDGSRVGRGTKTGKKCAGGQLWVGEWAGSCGWVGGWAGGGTSLHPEPDLWVAEMTDGGPLRLKVISEKSPLLSRGEDK